jgi:hypothetical protein
MVGYGNNRVFATEVEIYWKGRGRIRRELGKRLRL